MKPRSSRGLWPRPISRLLEQPSRTAQGRLSLSIPSGQKILPSSSFAQGFDELIACLQSSRTVCGRWIEFSAAQGKTIRQRERSIDRLDKAALHLAVPKCLNGHSSPTSKPYCNACMTEAEIRFMPITPRRLVREIITLERQTSKRTQVQTAQDALDRINPVLCMMLCATSSENADKRCSRCAIAGLALYFESCSLRCLRSFSLQPALTTR